MQGRVGANLPPESIRCMLTVLGELVVVLHTFLLIFATFLVNSAKFLWWCHHFVEGDQVTEVK